MPNVLATVGYSGNTIDHLKALVEQGALILDTRTNPSSRAPQWNRGNLQRVLGPAYEWQREMGNKNYKNGGPIEINDPNRTLWILKTALSSKPVVLLCGCANPATCHRSVVAQMAIDAGLVSVVTHLLPGKRLEAGNG